jgi:hypothetical protein
MTDIAALLTLASRSLAESGLDHATIGGCARNAYAEPRATKDVDFVVRADPAGYVRLKQILGGLGFGRATVVIDPGETVPDFEALKDASGRRIDLLFAKTEFEVSALDRARPATPHDSVTVPLVTAEDLVVYKLVAGRTQDWADVEVVVRTELLRVELGGREPFDWAYVEKWSAWWGVSERVEELRRRLSV